MPPPRELTGERFGRLVVLREADRKDWARNGPWRMRSWLCACDCGATVVVPTGRLTTRHGNATRSCGCLQRERASEAGRKATSHATPRTCRQCGIGFLGTHKQKYCSRDCKDAGPVRGGRTCPTCGAGVPDCGVGRRRNYCSERCKAAAEGARRLALEWLALAEELRRRKDA